MAARGKRVRSSESLVSPTPARKEIKAAPEPASAVEGNDALVFVTDDVVARAGMQAKLQEFSTAFVVEVITSWRQGKRPCCTRHVAVD